MTESGKVIQLRRRQAKSAERKAEPAEIAVFPILKAKHWRRIERDILKIAADGKGASISETLTYINRSDYMAMNLPIEVLRQELTRVGAYMFGKANTIRRMVKMPDVKVPIRRRTTGA